MSKHREALKALKTIANYCAGRDCHTECIFCRGEVESESCCYLVYDNHSPAHYVYDTDDLEPIEKRCEELEVNERIESYKDIEETRNICRKYADEIRGLGDKK